LQLIWEISAQAFGFAQLAILLVAKIELYLFSIFRSFRLTPLSRRLQIFKIIFVVMNIERPTLEIKLPFRRELLFSSIGSVFIVLGVFGSLALISISLATALYVAESSGPVVQYSEEIEKLEEVEEVSKNHEFSPSISIPPLSSVPLNLQLVQSPDAIPIPEIEEMPMMDDLAWSEETFEPWDEEKKSEVKPKPQVVRNPTSASQPSPAKVAFRCAPVYPTGARRSGIEGKVVVMVGVARSGRVSKARVASSSGSGSLDAAALKAARLYRFEPPKDSAGQGVETKAVIPFIFRLR
jgi:protein TonB